MSNHGSALVRGGSIALGGTQFLRLGAIIKEMESQGELSHDWTLGEFAVDGFAAVGEGVSVTKAGGADGFGAGETVGTGGYSVFHNDEVQ
jgi:hypothetical protein